MLFRSTHFAVRLGGMDEEREAIEEVRARRENVSRQLFGWIDSLQNSDIKGVRHLNDQTRRDYALTAARKDFREKLEALMALKDLEQTTGRTSNADKAPSCPTCGGKMVKRHDTHGRPFWGCAAYPKCRGSRNWEARC